MKKYVLQVGESLALSHFSRSCLKGNVIFMLRMVIGKGKQESK